MANQSIDNFKKYTYISVLSFKTFDSLCFSMYQRASLVGELEDDLNTPHPKP